MSNDLVDELYRSVSRMTITIYMDDFRLMPRQWMEQLVICLQARVDLRHRLDIRYRNYPSGDAFSKDAALTRTLDAELHALLLEVADTSPVPS
jgi:hypothetical protein